MPLSPTLIFVFTFLKGIPQVGEIAAAVEKDLEDGKFDVQEGFDLAEMVAQKAIVLAPAQKAEAELAFDLAQAGEKYFKAKQGQGTTPPSPAA
jgi:hypothetical protein